MNTNTGETPNQRLTRNVSDLLGELRVAQAGVQILFGFLLSVVFTAQFRAASGFEKSLHLSAVLLAVISTVLLTAPAAWHRLLFRTGRRDVIVRAGNISVITGLAFLAAAITTTVGLIAEVVFGPIAMAVVGGFAAVLFGVVWFVVPYWLKNDGQPVESLED